MITDLPLTSSTTLSIEEEKIVIIIITLKKIMDKVVELVSGGSVINGAYPV